jgi:hypothetical protein
MVLLHLQMRDVTVPGNVEAMALRIGGDRGRRRQNIL